MSRLSVVAVVALCMVSLGASCVTIPSASTLRLCSNGEGPLSYLDDPEAGCSGVEQSIIWERSDLPLSVLTNDDEKMRFLMREFNGQVGVRLFRPAEDGEIPRVVFAFGEAYEPGSNTVGETTHYFDGGRLYAEAYVSSIVSGPLEFRTGFHELGHVIGLSHSDSLQSIMYPIQPLRVAAWDDDGRFVRLLDVERNLLRRLYRSNR